MIIILVTVISFSYPQPALVVFIIDFRCIPAQQDELLWNHLDLHFFSDHESTDMRQHLFPHLIFIGLCFIFNFIIFVLMMLQQNIDFDIDMK